MKKLILLITLFAFTVMASAQFTVGVKLANATTDSIKTGALTVTKYISLSAGYMNVSIQPVVTKVSGTVGGIARLYGTVDGTNYIATKDTLTLTDIATNTVIWKITTSPYAKYKIVAVGTGTMNAVMRTWYLARKTITQ